MADWGLLGGGVPCGELPDRSILGGELAEVEAIISDEERGRAGFWEVCERSLVSALGVRLSRSMNFTLASANSDHDFDLILRSQQGGFVCASHNDFAVAFYRDAFARIPQALDKFGYRTR